MDASNLRLFSMKSCDPLVLISPDEASSLINTSCKARVLLTDVTMRLVSLVSVILRLPASRTGALMNASTMKGVTDAPTDNMALNKTKAVPIFLCTMLMISNLKAESKCLYSDDIKVGIPTVAVSNFNFYHEEKHGDVVCHM